MTQFAHQDAHDSSALLQIRRTRDERGTLLELFGELDISTLSALRQELVEAARDAPRRVLIDLTHLEFIDSAGLALVVDARKTAEAAGHELRPAAFASPAPVGRPPRPLRGQPSPIASSSPRVSATSMASA
jgi:anti-anti-sigma factor